MAGPAPVGVASGDRIGSGAVTVTLPAGAAGYVALVTTESATAPVATGWQVIDSGSFSPDAGHWYIMAAAAGASGTFTFTTSATAPAVVAVMGIDQTFAIEAGTKATGVRVAPSVTTLGSDRLIITGLADLGEAGYVTGYPTGATLGRVTHTRNTTAGYSVAAAMAAFTQSTSGASATSTWTSGDGNGPGVFSVSLKEAAPIPVPSLSALGDEGAIDVAITPVEGAASYVLQWRRTDLTPPAQTIQTSAPWGLDRMDQPTGKNGNYHYTYNGAGVRVYVFDSGVRYTHTEFQGRTAPGYSITTTGTYDVDIEPHGTAVASCVAGATFGTAKGSTVVSILIGYGHETSGEEFDWDGIADAIDWAIADAAGRPAVAVWSQWGVLAASPHRTKVDAMFARLNAGGIQLFAAYGNEGTLREHYPASGTFTLGVGGTLNENDTMWSGSAYHATMDLLAPAAGSPTATPDSNTSTATQSGTSFAAPYVAGIGAKILQANPRLSPARLREVILSQARPVVTGVPTGQTLLANSDANTDQWSAHATSAPTFSLDGLDVGAAYEVRAAAVVAGVTGPWSGAAAVTTTRGGVPARLGTRVVLARRVGTRAIVGMYRGSQRIM